MFNSRTNKFQCDPAEEYICTAIETVRDEMLTGYRILLEHDNVETRIASCQVLAMMRVSITYNK
jgi:hypothetical protein